MWLWKGSCMGEGEQKKGGGRDGEEREGEGR